MKKCMSCVLLTLIVLLIAGVAYAGSSTASLRVTATVVSYCTISTNPVNFGAVTGAGEITANATGSITVNCPADQAYHIALDAGLHAAGSARQISDGSYSVSYQLYKNSIEGSSWGDSDYSNVFPAGSSLSAAGIGTVEGHPVYGALAGFSGIPPGTFLSDTVTVTVYY